MKRKVRIKYYFMNIAHVIDVFRLIPRILVAGYGYMVWDSVKWFESLPDPTSQHTFLISTIVGGAAAVFGLYVNSGARWDDQKSADKDLYIETTKTGSVYTNSPQPTHHYNRPTYTQAHPQHPIQDPRQQRPEFTNDIMDDDIPPSGFGAD